MWIRINIWIFRNCIKFRFSYIKSCMFNRKIKNVIFTSRCIYIYIINKRFKLYCCNGETLNELNKMI